MEETAAVEVERPSPPPDSAVALRQGTASSIKRLQANGMKPTIIEDSESDEDAIISAKDTDIVDNDNEMKPMSKMRNASNDDHHFFSVLYSTTRMMIKKTLIAFL